MSNFVEKINFELKQRKISLQTLSKNTKISSSQLSKYASGNYEPSLKNAIIICDYFQCSLDYLFGLDRIFNRYATFKKENSLLFNERLQELIKLNKTNINKISKHTYINRNCFYHWQKNMLFPKVGILVKLAKELNTSIEYLVGRTDYKECGYDF